MQYRINYTCPECGHAWQETHDCACDMDCPKCRTRHISPTDWAELVPKLVAGKTRIVISLNGGLVQDVFCTDPEAEVTLIDWDTQDADDGADGLVDVGTDRAAVGGYAVSPWSVLVGTDCGDALEAAGIDIAAPTSDGKQPYTVILMMDSWDDFSIAGPEADNPHAAILAALIELGLAETIEEANAELEHISDVSVIEGAHQQVYGLEDLEADERTDDDERSNGPKR